MTGFELWRVRDWLRISQASAAACIGSNVQTVFTEHDIVVAENQGNAEIANAKKAHHQTTEQQHR